MTRLPPLTRDQASATQVELWDRIVASRGGRGIDMLDADGALMGPFHAMVRRPHTGGPMATMGAGIRFESSLEPTLLELAICTVGARWRSEFEFWAHRNIGLAAGMDDAVLDALAAGEVPPVQSPAEHAVYDYASALVQDGRVPQRIYDTAVEVLGVDSVIDLTMTVGYYTQVCFLLNAFEVALPPGESQTWADG